MSFVDDLAALATAVGLPTAVYQLHQGRRGLRDNFERTFVERYATISAKIHLDVLRGDAAADLTNDDVRRAFFDYFELCEEELYYRAHRRVSRATWKDWWYGIRLNLRNKSFKDAYDQLVAPAGAGDPAATDRFHHLRASLPSVEGDGPYSPPSARVEVIRRRLRMS